MGITVPRSVSATMEGSATQRQVNAIAAQAIQENAVKMSVQWALTEYGVLRPASV